MLRQKKTGRHRTYRECTTKDKRRSPFLSGSSWNARDQDAASQQKNIVHVCWVLANVCFKQPCMLQGYYGILRFTTWKFRHHYHRLLRLEQGCLHRPPRVKKNFRTGLTFNMSTSFNSKFVAPCKVTLQCLKLKVSEEHLEEAMPPKKRIDGMWMAFQNRFRQRPWWLKKLQAIGWARAQKAWRKKTAGYFPCQILVV